LPTLHEGELRTPNPASFPRAAAWKTQFDYGIGPENFPPIKRSPEKMIKTPFSTWDPQWEPTEHEVFRDFGFAGFTAQMLESSLVTILLAAEDAGQIEIKKPKKKKDLESELYLSERTLGQLIYILKEKGIDEDLTKLIEDALEARNYLMHHFFVWNSENYLTDEGRGRMLEELQQLRFRIGRSQIAFSQIREQIFEKVYGYSEDDLRKLYEDFRRRQNEGESGRSRD